LDSQVFSFSKIEESTRANKVISDYLLSLLEQKAGEIIYKLYPVVKASLHRRKLRNKGWEKLVQLRKDQDRRSQKLIEDIITFTKGLQDKKTAIELIQLDTIEGLHQWFKDKPEFSMYYEQLDEHVRAIHRTQEEISVFCSRKDIIQFYFQSIGQGQIHLDYVSALLYAAEHQNICIWQQENKAEHLPELSLDIRACGVKKKISLNCFHFLCPITLKEPRELKPLILVQEEKKMSDKTSKESKRLTNDKVYHFETKGCTFFSRSVYCVKSRIDPKGEITLNTWKIAFASTKRFIGHAMVLLEGLRPSGQRFLHTYHLTLIEEWDKNRFPMIELLNLKAWKTHYFADVRGKFIINDNEIFSISPRDAERVYELVKKKKQALDERNTFYKKLAHSSVVRSKEAQYSNCLEFAIDIIREATGHKLKKRTPSGRCAVM
jgi:hypothetical protein